jgi:hypothetical protein
LARAVADWITASWPWSSPYRYGRD